AGGWTQERQTLARPQVVAGKEGAASRSAPASSPAASPSTAGALEIRPPIMGTFYRAPQPGAAPFVEVGSRVAPETVVGIVETMKLMNSVYAGAHGTVIEICAANGELVDAERVLMRLAKP
ncbi:MAG TPA: biotin/lipoyl-containing protein, partial [Steroidobacteraceae bacterium]|nr:biotin/lipoyl-containing protein [Steroidobacteraceae bacterium]